MEQSRHLLLVEGTSDFGVVTNLWARHHRGTKPFETEPRLGLENLREAFAGFLLGSEVERLGIVVDADLSPAKRWPSFYQILVERGYKPVPKLPPAGGLVLHRPDRNVPVVGIWVMPDNMTSGALEDFVGLLVRPDDRLWEHAGKVVDEIPESLRRFKPAQRAKVHVHTWLAWQKDPGLRLGPAVERRLLDPGAPHAVQFVDWLRRLFVDPPPDP